MLKRRITKAEFDALTGDNAWQQKCYKVQGDGSYKLEAEPDEDTANLLSSKQAEKDRADALANELAGIREAQTALNTELATLRAEKATNDKDKKKKGGNFDEIEADYDRRLAEKDTAISAAEDKAKAQIKKLMIDGLANTIAAEISITPKHTARDLIERMDVDFTGPEPKLIILKDGKPSSMKVEDLRKEYVDSPENKAIIKASNASGGGANGNNGGSGGTTKPLKDMSETERTELYRLNPTEFRRLTAEASGATA